MQCTVLMMVLTLDDWKHQFWGSFLGRVRPDTRDETKQHHLSWNKVVTIFSKSENVTVSMCSGAKFGVQGANNLNRACMDKSQKEESVNRYSVVPKMGTENPRKYHTPGTRSFPLL